MPLKILTALLVCARIILSTADSYGAAIETRYSSIIYDNEQQLLQFNRELVIGSAFSFLFGGSKGVTIADDIKNKVDMVIEKVEKILEMYPVALKFSIVLLASENEVERVYMAKYQRQASYIAFYAPGEKTIYISARDAELQVIGHEIAHVVVHNYLHVAPSAKIHEVLAQYVATHLGE